MPGARPAGLLVALPALLALALVSWGPWRPPGSETPPGLLGELGRRRRDLSRLAAAVQAQACAAPPGRALGCADLEGATGVRPLASGITKRVSRALLPPAGEEVALKAVHGAGLDVSRCVQRYGHPAGCRRLAAYKLLKEMSLLRCLDHPGVVKLRGQCYDTSVNPEMKITTIMELGTPLEMIHLLQTPWEKRFKICLDLVELLQYLANSPLGSIALLDFQPRQFVMVDGVLKVTDLDDISTEELSCQTDKDCVLEFPTKNFSLKCAVHGKCEGINERRNLFNAYRYFFMYLLPHAAPLVLQPILKDILNATGDLRFGANETLRAFQKVLHLYKSGLYLQKKPSHLKEYIALKGFRSGTVEDYRCWPSYSHLGCMLSVHNAEEAADICCSHSQCQHFIITPQKTWTGRSLALFQSSSADLIPGNNTVVYVKRSTVSRVKPLTSSQKGYRDVREEIPTGTNFTPSKETTHFVSA
ncbi:extracellular tyrosine-protein kinase PKDCC-like [Eublepharis macularius]|uniref:Extracellular tyrosine-protein kinase PKDCC-like n=1 Tax=Eublepharis macularius TaxID=481883 RepID=A0AA97KRZ4_EUBMA|nr:extracellular tyrosine-protein kinase PKDCC-like [Eublepharis macularius]